jgi:hypothetical protein
MPTMLEALIDGVVDRLSCEVGMVFGAALGYTHFEDSVVDYLQWTHLPAASFLHTPININ